MFKAVMDIISVLASKTGGILINLIFLPIYQRLLPPNDFGIVALLISLQALLTVMDFGAGTLVTQDTSSSMANRDLRPAWKTWKASEAFLVGLFLLAAMVYLLGALGMLLLGPAALPNRTMLVLLSLFLLASVTINNLVFSALNALQRYWVSSGLQSGGVLLRAILTVAVLKGFGPTIHHFLFAQAAVAVIQVFVSRKVLGFLLTKFGLVERPPWTRSDLKLLVRRARPLALMGASGALTTQLDKTIISLNLSLASVGPYFLACTYALVPGAILGGSVAQYFLPRMIYQVTVQGTEATKDFRTVKAFAAAIALLTTIPATLLYLYCAEWIRIWLQSSAFIYATVGFAKVMLLGGTISSLTYLPFVLLTAAQDYVFLAKLSLTLTMPLLGVVWLFAAMDHLSAIPWVYVTYYAIIFFCNCWRAIALKISKDAAKVSLVLMGSISVVIIGVEGTLFLILRAMMIPSKIQPWLALLITAITTVPLLWMLRARLFLRQEMIV